MKTKKEIKKLSKKYWDKQPYNEDAYFEGYNKCQKDIFEEVELKDWDVTLNDGLENEPYISDDFQIGPDGAYEHNETIKVQQELINVLESQVMDLTMMSKIELGDDVIAEIKRLKQLINEQTR